MKLDPLDRRILEALQSEPELSNLELAEKVGLSPSPCSRRVKLLRDQGIIEKSYIQLNATKLNLKLTALVSIAMDRHTPERFDHFEAKIAAFPEVMECLLMTGQDADYLLKVVVPDMDYYREFLLDKLTRIKGVTGVKSSFVLRQVIQKTALPLKHV